MAFQTKQRKAEIDAVPYFSKEWIEQVATTTNADEKMQRIGRRLNERHCYIVLNCPGGTDRLGMFQWRNGEIVDWDYEERPSPANFADSPILEGGDYITTADYEFMKRVNTKQLNAMKAMMSPEMHLQGNRTRFMKQVKQMQHWQDIFAEIPVQYDV